MFGEHAIVVRAIDDSITGWTPGAARLSGYQADEVVGRSTRLLLPEGLPVSGRRTVLRRKDGSREVVLWVATPVHDAGGRPVAFTDLLIPVGASCAGALDGAGGPAHESGPSAAAVLRQLLDERERLERIVAAAPGAFYMARLTPDGIMSLPYASPAMEDLLGATAAQINLGLPMLAHVHPDDHARVRESTEVSARSLRPWQLDYRMLSATRGTIWVQGSGVPVREEDGSVQWCGFLQDITWRKRSEEVQLRVQKLEALGTLAGGIAHDFNNMLHVMTGNCALALHRLPDTHPARTLLEAADLAGARATDLVRRLLQFSRPCDGQRELLPLRGTVREALRLVRASVPSRIEIHEELGDVDPYVEADATHLHQIMLHLAGNAVHAIGDASGYLRVRLERLTIDPGDPRASAGIPGGALAALHVIDSGAGMDERTAARIFDPFFTTKQVGQGAGLGLSLVHAIMVSLGGSIAVRTTPGAGSTFTLYFPVRPAPAPRAAPAQVARADAGSRVLLVDDEPLLVELGTHLLETLGYSVLGFTNPRAALRAFFADPDAIDLAISDLAMPDLSGFEVAKRLLEVRPALPIVMLSGNVSSEERALARRLGLHAVLLKPVSIETLASTVQSALRAGAPPP